MFVKRDESSGSEPEEERMRIGELAQRADVTPRTIRH